jgi:hypothetical protein
MFTSCMFAGSESSPGSIFSRDSEGGLAEQGQDHKITRRERFLAEMDAVIPWERLLGLIEPH